MRWQFAHNTTRFAISALMLSKENPCLGIKAIVARFDFGSRWWKSMHAGWLNPHRWHDSAAL
jgi:hypothetical protein